MGGRERVTIDEDGCRDVLNGQQVAHRQTQRLTCCENFVSEFVFDAYISSERSKRTYRIRSCVGS